MFQNPFAESVLEGFGWALGGLILFLLARKFLHVTLS